MARRTVKRLVAALALAGFVSPALADPISAAVAIFTTVAQVSVWIKAALLIGMMAYGDAKTRRERRAMEAQARAQYNSSLVDRNVTLLRANPPARHVYGRCITGGDIVAVFTTDKTGYNDNNQPYTKPDAYKHIVVEFAHHQCQAMHDIQVDGKSIALSGVDVNGWSQATEFSRTRRAVRQVTLAAGASVTFDYPVVSAGGSMIAAYFGGSLNSFGNMGTTPTYTLTNGNKTLTNTSAQQATFSVAIEEVVSSVRVAYKLGTSTQVADTYLTTLLPTKWTTNHRLRGRCFAVVTLDLEDKRFQSSPPQITADISGKLLFDPRTSTTAWSDNNALCGRDYLLNVCKVPASMIDDSTVITAANACGSNVNNKKRINGTLTTVVKPKYTFNGTVTTDDSRESVLDAIADSMGGWISQSAKWAMDAGMWTAPVMTLNDDDLDGAISVVQGGTPMDSLFNGVRGQFIPAGTAVPIDFTPYKNAAFVTADGRNRWKNVNLPFTDDEFIATFLARILTERARNGMVIRYPAKLKAWPLRIGERVTVNSTEYGFSAKTFRVTDWQFAPDAQGSPVVLTLQEDAASAYDLIDEVNADPTPNTGLPNPFDVASLPAVSGLALLSDQTTIRRQSDGAAMPRVKVSWTLYTGPYVTDGSGYIYVKWQRLGRDAASAWNTERLPGNSTSTFIEGVTDGDIVIVGVWAENGAGGASSPAWDKVTAAGKTALPSDVTDFVAIPSPGQIGFTWNECTDVDYAETEIRAGGGTWAAGTTIFKGRATAFTYPQNEPASVLFRIKHWDTWGNQSLSEAFLTSSSLSAADTRNYDFTNGTDGWTNVTGTAANSTASGGVYGYFTPGGLGVPIYPRFTPIDPYRRYRVTARVYTTGSGPIFVGVITKDSAGNIISNVGGSTYNYCAASNMQISSVGTWRTITGEIGGASPQAYPTASLEPGKFMTGAVSAAPMIFPYTGFTGDLWIDYMILEDITDHKAVADSGFQAYKVWDFTKSLEGFTQVNNGLLTLSGDTAIQIASNGADPIFRTPALSFKGSLAYKIRMRIRRVSGTGWDGTVYYSTSGASAHGETGTYCLQLPFNEQPSDQWSILEWDVGKHGTAGTKSEWDTAEILQLRFDIGDSAADTFVIDWIAIGKTAAAADLGAVTNAQWVGRGVQVIGDTAVKSLNTSASWDADVYSREQYYGGAYASASIDTSTSARVMWGLNSDPLADANYSSLDYAWYYDGVSNQMRIYESDVDIGVIDTTPTSTDVWTVAYDGSQVYYLKNGAVKRSIAASPGQAFFFDSSFADANSKLLGMRFGPLSSNNWTAIGGSGKPSDYASADLTMVNDGNCVQSGNRVTKVADVNGWNAGAHTRNAYSGGAYISVYITTGMTAALSVFMFGLNDNPTTPSYTDLNFAFAIGVNGATQVDAYEEGSITATALTTFADGDHFEITYDGYTARWYKNGALLRSVNTINANPFFGDLAIWRTGTYVDRISFGPMSKVSQIATGQVLDDAITAGVQVDYDSGDVAVSGGSTSFSVTGISSSTYSATGGKVITTFYGYFNLRLASATAITQLQVVLDIKVGGVSQFVVRMTLAKLDGGSNDNFQGVWSWPLYHSPATASYAYTIDVTINAVGANFAGTETMNNRIKTVSLEFKK